MAETRDFDWRILRVVALVFLAVRLVLFLAAHPFMDETYYWLWGQHPALSYFDHPPLVGWTEGLFSVLGWTTLGLRAAPLLTLCGDLVLLSLLAKRLSGDAWQASFWPLAAIFLSAPIFILTTGSALPDHLLVFFGLLTIWAMVCLQQSVDAGPPRWRYLYLAGAAIGLAMLSKYTGAMLGAGLVAYIIVRPRLRPLFRSPHLYLAAFIALALQAPVLVWNMQHSFASFGFIVGGRKSIAAFDLVGLWGFVGGAVAVLGPVLLGMMLRFAWPRRDGLGYGRAVFWISTLAFLLASFFTNILIHWNVLAYVAVLPFLWPLLRSRALVALQLAYGVLALSAAAFNFVALPITAAVGPGNADQASSWSYGFDEVAVEVARLRRTEQIGFVAATDYALASPLAFALHDASVTSLSGRRDAFDDWFDPEVHRGQTALIVADRWRPLGGIKELFVEVSEVTQVQVKRFGKITGTYRIYIARDYRP